MNNDKGIVTLYFALIFVPVLFLATTVGFGIAGFFIKEKELQSIVDKSAIIGGQFLPQTDYAKTAAYEFASNALGNGVDLQITTGSDFLTVAGAQVQPFHMPFAKYFLQDLYP